jgi:carbon starvation protein
VIIPGAAVKALKTIFWVLISTAAAVSLAVVVRIVNPSEKVNALWIVVAAACFYLIVYRLYASFIAAKVLALDSRRLTPAIRLKDGADFDPTNRWVLFGHHFAAIAGAGPLLGPMLAAQFGYLPGFLWILIGSAFAGAVHDIVILTASVRRNGRSLAQIARDEIGAVAGFAASLAILFIIIVALAGLGLAIVFALRENSWGTFTIGCSIPIALLMGFYLRFWRPGKVGEVSLIGVCLLILAVVLGGKFCHSSYASFLVLSDHNLVVTLVVYGFIASVLPVWMLLCPRDYLSTYMKIGTVALLIVGVIVMHPSIQMPAFTSFVNGGGPIIPGKLFPFMFITIACGAISGFHALIASGTTPKMIMSEKQIPAIGFGAMLTEGMVSMMALIAATILVPGDYFWINTNLDAATLQALGFPIDKIAHLANLVGHDSGFLHNRTGGAVSLAVGMSSIMSSIPGLKHLMSYWYTFALMFEGLFILTTVDAGTRVARFLLQELGGKVYKPLGNFHWMPGTLLTSAVVVLAWGYLLYGGTIATIWRMFGVANQLLAGIALGVGTTLIIKSGKKRYAWVTAIPMAFMFVTTFTAAWQLAFAFRKQGSAAATPAQAFTFNLDALLVACMAALAAVTLVDMLYKWYGYLSGTREMKTTETAEYSSL